MKKKRSRQKSGYADTKRYPHFNHPAKYNRIGNDEVEYVTLTHHDNVNIGNKSYSTIPLNDNVDIHVQKLNKNRVQKDKEISYVFPKVFVGKRSALGRENQNYNLVPEDKVIVNELFKSLPRERVPYTNNSKRQKKNKKKESAYKY